MQLSSRPTVAVLALVIQSTITHAQESRQLSDSIVRGTLLYKAAGEMIYRDHGMPGFPEALGEFDVTVTVKNIGPTITQTEVQGCPVRMRGYTTPLRSGAPLYSEEATNRYCNQKTQTFSLDPNESRAFTRRVLGRDIAGEKKPLGPWYLIAEVHLPDTTLELRAGQGTVNSGLEHLDYKAQTRVEGVAPSSLVTTITTYNRGADTAYLEYGDCSNNLFAFRNPNKEGPPVWRYDRRAPPRGATFSYGCALILHSRKLAPGDSFDRVIAAPTHEILADSLRTGRYYFTVATDLNWRTIELDGGYADLSNTWDPVPTSRTFRGIQYSARLRRLRFSGGDSLELNLTVENHSGSTRRFRLRNGEEPVYLYGYSNQDRRDKRYLGNEPEWRRKALDLPEFVLVPGEKRVLRVLAESPPKKLHYIVGLWGSDDTDLNAGGLFIDLAVDER